MLNLIRNLLLNKRGIDSNWVIIVIIVVAAVLIGMYIYMNNDTHPFWEVSS